MSSSLTGTGVALVTPFNDDLTVDFNGLKKLVNHVSEGVDYLVVNGTTAESATTTEKEKEEILAFVLKENAGKLPVVAGIGGNNTSEVIKKIKSTNFKGINAILSVSPYYNKPSQEGIFQHYKAIAEACPVPVILYNVPGRTSMNMKVKTIERLAEIENVIGIKEASGDMMQALEVTKIKRNDFLLISGDDLLTPPMISMGSVGVISVIANAFPVKFSEMVKLALHNDFKKSSDILRSFIELNPLLYQESNPVGIKEVLEQLGICKANVRMPLWKASDELKGKISQAIKKLK